MGSESSTKYIGRNSSPRVHIEYAVPTNGAEKKVELPFVMGVLADLSGQPAEDNEPPSVADREFLDIDIDNFNDRMAAIKPRAAFAVKNTLTGEGNLPVELTFEKMDDFSPAAVAQQVEPLRQLLEARTQLSNLLTYVDGRANAEALLSKILQDKTLLAAVVAAPKQGDEEDSTAKPEAEE